MARLLSLAIAMGLALAGCSSVRGSAVRTGPVQMPAYAGPVAIYSVAAPPANAVDLGVVEVHALQQEGSVDHLLPQFVRKVADIGGNVAVVEGVRARFEIAGRSQVETFYYTCPTGATCGGMRVYNTNDEIMIVTMFGRAMTTQLRDIGPPLVPVEPPPPETEPEPAPEVDIPPAGAPQ